MSWLAPKLRDRVQIRKAVQDENETTGGFDRSYTTLTTIWAEIVQLTWQTAAVRPIRHVNTNESSTHKFKVRRCALDTFGVAFTKAFSSAFNSIADTFLLKADYFLFLEQGSTTQGRLFRINSVVPGKERKEYLEIIATELEELGTGFSI